MPQDKCCLSNPSEDVKLYTFIDTVAREIARDPERFKLDLDHPIKGIKLRKLMESLSLFDT